MQVYILADKLKKLDLDLLKIHFLGAKQQIPGDHRGNMSVLLDI